MLPQNPPPHTRAHTHTLVWQEDGGRGEGEVALFGVLAVIQTDAEHAVGAGDDGAQSDGVGIDVALGSAFQLGQQVQSGLAAGDDLPHVVGHGDALQGGLGMDVNEALLGQDTQRGLILFQDLNQFHGNLLCK